MSPPLASLIVATILSGASLWTLNEAVVWRHGCPTTPTTERLEQQRIQAHLASVERELRARDVEGLSPRQRAARERNLDVLHAYWTRGGFPHNHHHPGERVPHFVDEHGTRCAMAHLIEVSGGAGLVRRVAATRNNARIRELAGDRELVAWLDDAGLTAAEAARIQPAYEGEIPRPFDDYVATGERHTYYEPLAVTASLLQAGTIALNADSNLPWSQRRPRAVIGFLAGVTGLAVGGGGFMLDNGSGNWAFLTTVLSAANLGLSIRSLNQRDPSEDAEAALRGRPVLYVGADEELTPHLAVRVSF